MSSKARFAASAPIGVAIAVLLAGTGCGDATESSANHSLVEQFDFVWETFDASYSYFVHKNIDWTSLRASFRPQAEAATGQSALVNVVQQMLARLRDRHVNLIDPGGRYVPTFIPDHFVNFNRAAWQQAVSHGPFTQVSSRVGFGLLNGAVAYLAIESWNPSEVQIGQIDAAIDQFRDAAALIIDVRVNGGGDDRIAYQVAGRFADEVRTTGFIQFRNGPAHTDFTAPTPRQVTPRGAFQFTRPVILLVGRGCLSSNESFVAAMGEFPHVTVLGDTTGGSTANPANFDLGGGWRFSVSRWIEYTARMEIIEDHGIAPDIVVPVTSEAFGAGHDPVLDQAISRILQQAGNGVVGGVMPGGSRTARRRISEGGPSRRILRVNQPAPVATGAPTRFPHSVHEPS